MATAVIERPVDRSHDPRGELPRRRQPRRRAPRPRAPDEVLTWHEVLPAIPNITLTTEVHPTAFGEVVKIEADVEPVLGKVPSGAVRLRIQHNGDVVTSFDANGHAEGFILPADAWATSHIFATSRRRLLVRGGLGRVPRPPRRPGHGHRQRVGHRHADRRPTRHAGRDRRSRRGARGRQRALLRRPTRDRLRPGRATPVWPARRSPSRPPARTRSPLATTAASASSTRSPPHPLALGVAGPSRSSFTVIGDGAAYGSSPRGPGQPLHQRGLADRPDRHHHGEARRRQIIGQAPSVRPRRSPGLTIWRTSIPLANRLEPGSLPVTVEYSGDSRVLDPDRRPRTVSVQRRAISVVFDAAVPEHRPRRADPVIADGRPHRPVRACRRRPPGPSVPGQIDFVQRHPERRRHRRAAARRSSRPRSSAPSRCTRPTAATAATSPAHQRAAVDHDHAERLGGRGSRPTFVDAAEVWSTPSPVKASWEVLGAVTPATGPVEIWTNEGRQSCPATADGDLQRPVQRPHRGRMDRSALRR